MIGNLDNCELVDEEVHVDGRRFLNVVFRDCILVYSGGALPVMFGCSTPGSSWALRDAARRTLALLLYLNSPEQILATWDRQRANLRPRPSWDPDRGAVEVRGVVPGASDEDANEDLDDDLPPTFAEA